MVGRQKRFAVVWRRAGLGLRAVVLLLGLALFVSLVFIQQPRDEFTRPGDSLLVITLVNFIVVVLCVLAFLIGRNIVKLIFDRRRGILGTQLRTRLVFALVALTLIPTGILFFSASGLLARAMEGWFSTTVEQAVGGAVQVSRRHNVLAREQLGFLLEDIQTELRRMPSGEATREQLLERLEAERKRWRLFSIRILSGDGGDVLRLENAVAQVEPFREPDLNREALAQALAGEVQTRFEERESSQFIRAYGVLPSTFGTSLQVSPPLALVLTLRLSPELAQGMAVVNDSFREYEQLKLFRGGLRSNYLLTLALITGLLIFSAIWIAFYIARELAVPIQRVADATKLVAKGRDDIQLRDMGDDEMGQLVRAFNRMTLDLRKSRQERERHRAYLETLLRNLGVGVVGIDPEHRISSINPAAAEVFGITDLTGIIGRPLRDALPAAEHAVVAEMLAELSGLMPEGAAAERAVEREIMVRSRGREHKLICTAGRILSDQGDGTGFALLFDDVTELSKAQHMAAWREAAQRIAHEIKNPLTPIQLSAQRLERFVREEQTVKSEAGLYGKIAECTETIVSHVDSIKRLANEFSQFARMPPAEFSLSDLNDLIATSIEPFASAQHDIIIQFIRDDSIPQVSIDKEQMRRVIINLLDNAIAAVREARERGNENEQGRALISIRTWHDSQARTVSFEIRDTGPGIPPQTKTRIFDPYVTTKKGGTGLGLAIVTSIVTEHQGQVRVFDNQPRGARFVVELPERPQRGTQRKFAV